MLDERKVIVLTCLFLELMPNGNLLGSFEQKSFLFHNLQTHPSLSHHHTSRPDAPPTNKPTMKFIASLLLVSSASAMELATPDVSASSKIGARLLSKARQLEGNKDGDITWISGYSLKFQKCATSKDYYGGYFGGEFECLVS